VAAVISLDTQTFLGHNQATYQDLRLALQLNLRRQLLLAVCDDGRLQTQLAQRLEADLNHSQGSGSATSQSRAIPPSPMVTLPINADQPDPVRQVMLWLKQQRLLKASAQTIPAFQIVGLEQLTQRSPTIQNQFLASLTYVDALITRLDCRLLVWVPRPWLSKIQQAVPDFWRSRSGLFEFMGDPTPTAQRPVSFEIAKSAADKDINGRPVEQPITLPPLQQAGDPNGSHQPQPEAPDPDQSQNLWTVLREDLSAFEHPTAEEDQPPSPASPRRPSAATPDSKRRSHPPSTSASPPTADQQSPKLMAKRFTVVEDNPLASVVLSPTRERLDTPPSPPPGGQGANLPPGEAETAAEDSVPAGKPPHPAEPLISPPLSGRDSPLQSGSSAESLPAELAEDQEVLTLWRYACNLDAQQAGPLSVARAYLGLGQKSRDLIEAGTITLPLLDFAISSYRKAISGLLEGDENWCDAMNDLASLYWLRSQQENAAANVVQWLQHSIGAYRKALGGSQHRTSSETLLRLYSNLGTVYSLVASLDDPLANLQPSQTAYRQALPYAPAEIQPIEYANLQNSLGAVHWRLAQLLQPQQHLHAAIQAYSEALRFRQPQATPLEYAMIQNNLGIACWNLSQHESTLPLLKKAVEAYRAALQYRTLDTLPHGCAATYNNLGTAYWDLAQHHTRQPEQRLSYLQQAIVAYEKALSAAEVALQTDSTQSLGFDVWATFHSAGVVHDQLAQALPAAQAGQRKLHLQQGLSHYLLAYQGWQDNPQQLEVLVTAFVYNVHLSFEILGLAGQQAALSQVPGELLPDILRQL
jgi:tetratricopeptide (TPR) repeat protein